MSELSSAAQAILNAYMKDAYGRISTYAQHRLACAIREAALYAKNDKSILISIADELEDNLPEFLDSSTRLS